MCEYFVFILHKAIIDKFLTIISITNTIIYSNISGPSSSAAAGADETVDATGTSAAVSAVIK